MKMKKLLLSLTAILTLGANSLFAEVKYVNSYSATSFEGSNSGNWDYLNHSDFVTYENGYYITNSTYKRDKNLDPFDISYEDYQYLNFDALEIIFGKNTKELYDAAKINNFSTLTNDQIVNKIYFDKLHETKGEGEEWESYLHTRTAVSGLSFEEHIKNITNNKIDTSSSEKMFTTKNKLFNDFNQFKDTYLDNNHNWQIDTNAVIKAMDEIKTEYEKRVAENEALLKELTKNNKPNPLENIESSDG